MQYTFEDLDEAVLRYTPERPAERLVLSKMYWGKILEQAGLKHGDFLRGLKIDVWGTLEGPQPRVISASKYAPVDAILPMDAAVSRRLRELLSSGGLVVQVPVGVYAGYKHMAQFVLKNPEAQQKLAQLLRNGDRYALSEGVDVICSSGQFVLCQENHHPEYEFVVDWAAVRFGALFDTEGLLKAKQKLEREQERLQPLVHKFIKQDR